MSAKDQMRFVCRFVVSGRTQRGKDGSRKLTRSSFSRHGCRRMHLLGKKRYEKAWNHCRRPSVLVPPWNHWPRWIGKSSMKRGMNFTNHTCVEASTRAEERRRTRRAAKKLMASEDATLVAM